MTPRHAKSRSRKRPTKKSAKPKRVSRLRKPDGLSLDAWQIALRRQYAGEQGLRLKNVGDERIFSDFEVTNPQTKRTYRVAIRGEGLGVNYCSCPDYAVNMLGTCKHIEYALSRLRTRRGGRAALAGGSHPSYSEVFLRYGAKREVMFRAGTNCPPKLATYARRFFRADGVLRAKAYATFHRFLARVTGADGDGHEVRCYDDALGFVSRARDQAELLGRIDRAFPDGADSKAFGKLVRAKLYPYQRAGALFAARAGRCLLADDMGLGKTVQAIAAAEILARHADLRRVLVICPTSLKHQWRREIEKFAQRSAVVIEGSPRARRALYANEGFYQIVNYDVLHRDLPALQAERYDLIVLDEAQRIKNWKTRAAKAVKQLESDFAFVLTGTPLENRLEELHSIVEFVDRHRLGPMFRFLATHQHVDESGRVIGYRALDDVARTLAPILVRRTKKAVLKDLPERLEKRFFVEMTDPQRQLHEDNRETVARIVQKWRRRGYLTEIDQRRLTCALQNMRMSCNSTFLLDKKTDHGHKVDELASLLDEILEAPDAKVVVFSQWLGTHELIRRRLARRKVGHVLFHGGVPSRKRKDLVAKFREDPSCRLFLSTDAGGVGLNLQHASVVVNMDLPWNPAVLEQRIGRVHRLGQHRPVRVVHFVAKGTIEEGMLGLLAFKTSMFAGVLDGGAKEVFLGGTRLRKFMDSVEKATAAIPAPPADAGGPARATAQSAPASGAGQGASPAAAAGPGVSPAAAAAGSQQAARQRADGPGPSGQGTASPRSGPVAAGPAALGELLTAGAAILQELGQSLRDTQDSGVTDPAQAVTRWVGRDEDTGRSYLKLPLPPGTDAARLLAGALHAAADALSPHKQS